MKFIPHDYQQYAIQFLTEHPVAALLLDMGLGKTVTTLTAINELLFDRFEIRRVLVIAPLRVARDTWSAEIEKWEHLKHLKYSVAVGTSAERRQAINCIMQGETYIQPSLVPALNSRLVSRDIDKEKINSLTKRELEVLIEVANGMFNKEIATSLNISERTVKNHISNIFKKIDVSDRTQAAVFAIKNNLIKLY